LRFGKGLNLHEIFRGFFPPNIPYFNRRAFRNGLPFYLFLLIDNPIPLHQLDRPFASLMEPDALLSAPDCSPA